MVNDSEGDPSWARVDRNAQIWDRQEQRIRTTEPKKHKRLDKKKQNVKISVKRVTLASKQGALQKLEFDQMRELHPGVQVMARGNVIPVYVCTKKIRMGDEILTDYNWTNKEWQRNLKRKR